MVGPSGRRALLLGALLAGVVVAGCSSDPGTDAGGDTRGQVDDEDFDPLDLDADETTGILRGVVIDEAIRPLAGVAVNALGMDVNVTMTTLDDGLFGFDGLAPGTYFVSVAKPRYVTTQTSAEVVAGDDDPDAVKLLMAADPLTRPYVQPYHLDGYMTCSVRPMFIGAQCGFFAGDSDVVNSQEWLPTRPDWIQSEMVWDSTQAVGDELSLAIRCQDGDSDPAGKCPDGVLTIVRAEGVSPQVATINRTVAEAWALGGEGGDPFNIELFAFGRSDLDVWNEQTIDEAQEPVTGRPCMEWPNPAGLGPFGSGTCMRLTGPGAVINQKIDVYSHVFYGYTPPEGWLFIEDGEPPAPPA